MFPNARKAFLGVLFLTFSAGALGLLFLLFCAGTADADGNSPKLYALQNGLIVTSVTVGSTFEIQATHVKNSPGIYLYAFPMGNCGFTNPYSSQNLSQAACVNHGGDMTCTWIYKNGSSPQLYPGTWCFDLVDVTKGGTSVTILEKTILDVN
jgi:hypothetical protein